MAAPRGCRRDGGSLPPLDAPGRRFRKTRPGFEAASETARVRRRREAISVSELPPAVHDVTTGCSPLRRRLRWRRDLRTGRSSSKRGGAIELPQRPRQSGNCQCMDTKGSENTPNIRTTTVVRRPVDTDCVVRYVRRTSSVHGGSSRRTRHPGLIEKTRSRGQRNG